jgi:hypothetical protein
MPESPRWYIMRGETEKSRRALCKLRSQPPGSKFIQRDLEELIKNHEAEITQGAGSGSWLDCFRGGWKRGSNLQLTLLGMGLMAMQQLSKCIHSLPHKILDLHFYSWREFHFLCKNHEPPIYFLFWHALRVVRYVLELPVQKHWEYFTALGCLTCTLETFPKKQN